MEFVKSRYLLGMVVSLTIVMNLSACMSESPSPEARARARIVLEETSPRNLNDHPKVTCPNVGYTFSSGDCRGKTEVYNQRLCTEDD